MTSTIQSNKGNQIAVKNPTTETTKIYIQPTAGETLETKIRSCQKFDSIIQKRKPRR